MGEIVVFDGMKQDMLWTCQCGENDFWLLKGGEIVCPTCLEAHQFRWFDPAQGGRE